MYFLLESVQSASPETSQLSNQQRSHIITCLLRVFDNFAASPSSMRPLIKLMAVSLPLRSVSLTAIPNTRREGFACHSLHQPLPIPSLKIAPLCPDSLPTLSLLENLISSTYYKQVIITITSDSWTLIKEKIGSLAKNVLHILPSFSWNAIFF